MYEKANIERPGLLHRAMPASKNCLQIFMSKKHCKKIYKNKKVVHTWVCSKLVVMTLKTSFKRPSRHSVIESR